MNAFNAIELYTLNGLRGYIYFTAVFFKWGKLVS